MTARLRRRDAGMTLIETLVAMVLVTIVIGLATTALVNVIRAQDRTSQSTNAQDRNQVAVELITRLLRQATYPQGGTSTNSTIITTAQPTKLVFTSRMSATGAANSNTDATFSTAINEYAFQLNGTTLQWGYSPPPNSCTGVCTYTAPAASRAILYGVRNAANSTVCAEANDGAVFHYYQADPNTGSLNLLGSSVASGSLDQVAAVKVDLYTKPATTAHSPGCQALTAFVDLRNFQS